MHLTIKLKILLLQQNHVTYESNKSGHESQRTSHKTTFANYKPEPLTNSISVFTSSTNQAQPG